MPKRERIGFTFAYVSCILSINLYITTPSQCPTTTAASNITTLGNFETTIIFPNHSTTIKTTSAHPLLKKEEMIINLSLHQSIMPKQKIMMMMMMKIILKIKRKNQHTSSALWENRKEYIKQWWKPNRTRGVVWLDSDVRRDSNEKLPEIRISEDTERFRYTNRLGSRSALRISRWCKRLLSLE
ncbi:putative peroxisome assembly protein 12 [Bienertia sinuspersici]